MVMKRKNSTRVCFRAHLQRLWRQVPVFRTFRSAAAFALLLMCAVELRAQRVIYDQSKDKTAQDTVAAAKEITSGSLFEKMLRNVDLQGKQEADTQMAWVEQQMRAKLENFRFWSASNDNDRVAKILPGGAGYLAGRCESVKCELQSLEVRLKFFQNLTGTTSTPDQIAARLSELEKKKEALDQALKELQTSSKSQDPVVLRTFDLLNDNGKNVIDYAKQLTALAKDHKLPIQGISTGLDKVGDGLDQMLSLYNVVEGIWKGYQAVNVDPASLRPPQEQIDLQLLALEQDHLKTITLILARESIEAGAAFDRVETAISRLDSAGVLNSKERVEDTLRGYVEKHDDQDHDRWQLVALLDALHEAAAAVAEEDAAGRLATLRLSDEERRYSIRRSAVNSAIYDQTIQAASQRLALYWKSGIKPSELAQLIFYVANTAGVSAIAAQ